MFRKEFASVISKTGMVPLRDLRSMMMDNSERSISELGLLNLDFFDDVKFAKRISENTVLTFVELSNTKINDDNLRLLNRNDIIRFRALPIQKNNNAITLAIFDPTIVQKKKELYALLNYPVEFVLTNIGSWSKIYDNVEDSIDDLVGDIKEVDFDPESSRTDDKEEDIGEEVINYVNKILATAFMMKASDIHVEPYENIFRIRMRVDGSLAEFEQPARKLMLPIISRLKLMSQMDISEKRKPQDGRFKLIIGKNPIDFRVSALPTIFGEKVVLRLLNPSGLNVDINEVGMDRRQMDVLRKGIATPNGICLITGPTGSGKTTTLYSVLSFLNDHKRNLSTVEDPVEFNLEGINQVNVNKDAGMTFPTALKAFLRQDPDIIMVGEIRDMEVGEIAIEAALTGHLVLSTLHTNDTAATVTRLLNMGIQPFLLVACLNVIVAQRLCRKICDQCKEIDDIPIERLMACGITENSARRIKVYRGKGCESCNNTGYKGRVPIHEVMEFDRNMQNMILSNSSAGELKKQAVRNGMKTLRMTALTKVAKGLISLDECLAASGEDKF